MTREEKKKLILSLAGIIIGLLLIGRLFSWAWSSYYPPLPAQSDKITAQAEMLRDLVIALLAFGGTVLGIVAPIAYVKRKKDFSPEELGRHLSFFCKTVVLLTVSVGWGIFLLLNLVLKVPQLGLLPLAVSSIRTDLFLRLSSCWEDCCTPCVC